MGSRPRRAQGAGQRGEELATAQQFAKQRSEELAVD